ncbi:hypothetical protein ACIHAX_30845 [Nocardia sp. NPDC051929]|uniref:hypothetical protein n=1 Tax=Nocardia sp. NPDC051929 TaxID=3364327 RepID=UPI0037C93FFE
MPTWTSKPARTLHRIAAVREYMATNVLGPGGFRCGNLQSCRNSALYTRSGTLKRPPREFWEGQMSHIGLHYDMVEDGRPWRVMLLAMEVGRAWEHISLEERREDQDNAINVSFSQRKPHMRGTTSALRLAFGRRAGADRAGELLELTNAGYQHVMACYALVNLRLCSAVAAGTTNSAATEVMSANCLAHLVATVRALEPTVCVLQGSTIRSAIDPAIENCESLSHELPLEYVTLGGIDTIVANFPHPYQRGRNVHLNWGTSSNTAYLTDVVAPTLRAAREFALS